jgi:heme/copper-type cytochrome/quinol oxidase subunit 4
LRADPAPAPAPALKIVVILLLLAVIASLFSGLFFVYKDKGESNRVVISLTIRVVLSLLVFAILIGSYFFGLVPGGRL